MGLGMAQGAAKAGGLKDFYKREVYMLKETYKRTLDLSKKTFERDILTEHGNGSGYGAGCCQGSVCTRAGSRNAKNKNAENTNISQECWDPKTLYRTLLIAKLK